MMGAHSDLGRLLLDGTEKVWKARCSLYLVSYVQGVENDRRKSFTKRVVFVFTPSVQGSLVDITIYMGRNVLVAV